jgi:hypothetical protein
MIESEWVERFSLAATIANTRCVRFGCFEIKYASWWGG